MGNFDSTDRKAGEYLLFALAFLGFLLALAGVTVSSSPLAFCGGLLMLLCVLAFRGRSARL